MVNEGQRLVLVTVARVFKETERQGPRDCQIDDKSHTVLLRLVRKSQVTRTSYETEIRIGSQVTAGFAEHRKQVTKSFKIAQNRLKIAGVQ